MEGVQIREKERRKVDEGGEKRVVDVRRRRGGFRVGSGIRSRFVFDTGHMKIRKSSCGAALIPS